MPRPLRLPTKVRITERGTFTLSFFLRIQIGGIMKRSISVIVFTALVAALVVPANAYARESRYVRLNTGEHVAVSASSTSRWLRANQGTVERNRICGIFATIQSRSAPGTPWLNRSTIIVWPGSGASSSVGSDGTRYHWRLHLRSLSGLAFGEGIINSFDR